jgi:hypothetical protein
MWESSRHWTRSASTPRLCLRRLHAGRLDSFEYIYGLTAIVVGLAVTRLVTGLAQLLQARKRTPPYWVHILWMVNTLLAVIITWWVQFRWRHVAAWSLPLVVWLLVAPMMFSFAAALLLPNEQEGEPITDWRSHYYGTKRSYFLLLASTFVVDLIDTLLKGWSYFVSIGPLYICSMLMWATLCTIAAFTRASSYHAALAVFFLFYNALMLGSDLLRLI